MFKRSIISDEEIFLVFTFWSSFEWASSKLLWTGYMVEYFFTENIVQKNITSEYVLQPHSYRVICKLDIPG